jgi:ceramide glucosyltransferase
MTLEPVLAVLAAFVLIKGLAGALDGFRYDQYIRRHLARRPDPWLPQISVILPCKGLDFELERNVEAVFRQVYPFFEVLIVTATADDLARSPLERLAARFPGHQIRFVTAGVSDERGEKVNNLIQGVAQASPSSEILVFADSDSRPHLLWLQELVAPLRNEQIGVSTGYRWYYPAARNLASVIRSVWNGAIATLLGNHDHNFAWGGSMAVRKTTFQTTRVLDYWRHSLSDDYSLTEAMKNAKLKIHYEPRCLLASYGHCSWKELIEWSTRQMIITRIYSQKLWTLAAISQWSFVLVWWWAFAGVLLLPWKPFAESAARLLWQAGPQKYATLLALLFLFGAVRGIWRIKTIVRIHPQHRPEVLKYWWGYVFLFPLASTLTAYNLVASAWASSLHWRGVRYELQSSKEMRVVRTKE